MSSVVVGIELGSTRIKAVAIDQNYKPVASGSHEWENRLDNGLWTYSLEDIWQGVQAAYADLVQNYGKTMEITAIGVSAMMHGYMAFDGVGELLCPFRTWRNTNTARAAEALTKPFRFNIPQRWSVAHLYQATLDREEHVPRVAFLTTLAGYVHWKLTGEKALGMGDASGMFPLDELGRYNPDMLQIFDIMTGRVPTPEGPAGPSIRELLPQIVPAGQCAGRLTPQGALLLDPTGALKPGVPFAPPEGDAGTGMVATCAVAPRRGNVSAGTSVFAMLVLEKPFWNVYPEIDMVTTPTGRPVAMVHANTCTSDLDAWVGLFGEVLSAFGQETDKTILYKVLYNEALKTNLNNDIISYNCLAGEPVLGLDKGRPLLARLPEARLTLPGLMRCLLMSSLASLRAGMDILAGENVQCDILTGHGGLFKTAGVGQEFMANMLNMPVTVQTTAGEGGAWGAAVLAAYMVHKEGNESLEAYLDTKVFANAQAQTVEPEAGFVAECEEYMKTYKACLPVERAAGEVFGG